MARMVRKQIYIQKRQQDMLKKISKSRGTSEAEVIRNALDRELQRGATTTRLDPQSWERAYQFMVALHEKGPLEKQTHDWVREDLYEERLSRYDRDTH